MRRMPSASTAAVELNAVVVALIDDEPRVLALEDGALLPSGPFASEHPTLQAGLRAWVERQTRHPLGYRLRRRHTATASASAMTSNLSRNECTSDFMQQSHSA